MDNFISTTVLLFILLDPIGNALLLPSLLKNVPPQRVRRIILREMFIALAILLVLFFVGNELLRTLKLQNQTLAISGAIVLFLIALGMIFPTIGALTSSASRHHDGATATPAEEDAEPFIVPIAIPLIAGPSTIAVVMLNGAKSIGTPSGMLFVVSICAAWTLSLGVFLVAPRLLRALGRRGSLALERLVGILLILIAVQMFMDGLKECARDFFVNPDQAAPLVEEFPRANAQSHDAEPQDSRS